MKKLFLLTALALLSAWLITLAWTPMSPRERAIAIQASEAPAPVAAALKNEPVPVQAVVLGYGDDPVLQLKARTALLAYPQLAREVLPLYGAQPEFREVLRRYGEAVLPPIAYFLRNDVYSLHVMRYAARMTDAAKQAVRDLRGASGRDGAVPQEASAKAARPADDDALTPALRGWYAVNFIKDGGHDFLGQFVVDEHGQPKWLQSERILEGVNGFFASGVRNLENKYKTDQEIGAGDVGSAALDGLFVAGAVKLLRFGRAAATAGEGATAGGRTAAIAAGEGATAGTRTAEIGSALSRAGRFGMNAVRYGKWPAIALTAYLAVKHPGIINDTLAGLASLAGVPTWFGQFVGWWLLLLPLFYLGTWALRLVLRPAIMLLRGMQGLLAWLEGRKRRRGYADLPEPAGAPQGMRPLN